MKLDFCYACRETKERHQHHLVSSIDRKGDYAYDIDAMKFDTFLSAEEAVAYGLADQVISQRSGE